MGAVLEMTRKILVPLLVIFGLGVSGCGTEQQGPVGQIASNVKGLLQSDRNAVPPGPDDLLTREVIDGVTVPYAMVGVEQTGAYASMTIAGANGDDLSWVTGDGVGIVLQAGLVTGTKGFGADLSSADISGLAALIARGAGQITRVHSYIDGEGRGFSISYRCLVSAAPDEQITIIGKTYATRVVKEACVSSSGAFENEYWIGKNDGVMWQSRQWVSTGVGHLLLLTLVPVAR